ncbi:MAG: hypothetical protein R3B46_10340 [Phycisphaerales bacterium]
MSTRRNSARARGVDDIAEPEGDGDDVEGVVGEVECGGVALLIRDVGAGGVGLGVEALVRAMSSIWGVKSRPVTEAAPASAKARVRSPVQATSRTVSVGLTAAMRTAARRQDWSRPKEWSRLLRS